MQFVMLAAGKGARFGGLKQIAPVGPDGAALMDLTAQAAAAAGFEEVVLVLRPSTADEVLRHVARRWPVQLPVRAVLQDEQRAGTVPAVMAAAPVLSGPFAVANADDCYGAEVLAQLHDELARATGARATGDHPVGGGGSPSEHVLVCFELVRTVLTADPVKRGLCVSRPDGTLADLVEHHVRLRADGRFDVEPLDGAAVRSPFAPGVRVLEGHEPVSMNLWGFQHQVLDDLADALTRTDRQVGEVLLPEVVGRLVRDGGARVRCCPTPARCLGLTHREDLAVLQEQLSLGALDVLRP